MRCGIDHYKVGVATYVIKRQRNLQTSNPIKIEVVATRLVESALSIEKKMHDYLTEHRADGGGTEWFKLEPQQLIELLVMINQEPEVLASYDIIEMKKLLAAQLENRREMNKKLDNAIAYIKKTTERTLARKAFKLEQETAKSVVTVGNDDDEIFDLALNAVRAEEKASTSMLQRRLRIGYARAARIIERMEKEGLIGEADGSRPREVYNIDA